MAFLQDLRFGLRTFVRAPTFTIVAVAVLALGIGANTAIFTIVNTLLFKPLSGRAGELVGVYSRERTTPGSFRAFSYPNFDDIRTASGGLFEGLFAHDLSLVGVSDTSTSNAPTARVMADIISSNYFEVLDVPLAAGRPFTAAEEQPGAGVPVAIVDYAFWQARHFDPAVLGSQIRVNGRDLTIVGIAPRGFTGTMALIAPEIFLPLGMHEAVAERRAGTGPGGLASRANGPLIVAGRLAPGLSEAGVAARLDTLSRQLEAAYPAENRDQALTVEPLARMSTSTSPQSDTGLVALASLMLGLSATVLLIACLNLANMLLARGAGRRKELAVRLAVGADRGRLIRQLLTESLSLAIAGALLGLMLAYWATGALSASLAAVMPIAIALDPAPDGRVLAATVLFAVLSTVGFGLGPALRLSRRDLVTDLKDSGADAPRARRLLGVRNLMVVGQVALSLGLLVAGGIFVREAVQASHTNPGYAYDNLFIATAAPDLGGLDEAAGRRAHAAILEAVRALPGIERAGSASTVPFGDEHSSEALERVGAATPAGGGRARASRIVGADYFAALGLPMIRGREFTLAEEQAADVPAVVIVDAVLAASLFGDEDPIGQTVRLQQTPGAAVVDQTPMQVVGVAPPIKDELLDRGPASHVYLPLGRHYRSTLHVHARALPGADEQTMTAALRTALATADARVPVLAVSPMRTFHDRSLELWALRAGGQLFAGLGILAVALAMIGLYGLKSFVVAQRTREIGIRIALGATRADVLRLVFRDGLALLAIGLAVGVPIAIAVSMTMGAIFVGLGGFDPLVVALAAIALTTAAVAATLVPARRASRISPLTALRSS